ncbi:MAG: PadR family transcriptional regulator [Anaerolineae bacterium]
MCDAHHGELGKSASRCCPPQGRVRGFVQPWVLLLLAQAPAHGYDLMERLSQGEESPGADPGLLYRTLRQFEEEGLVRSSWDTEGGGPARRVYEISAEGLDYLHAWAVNIRRTRRRLDRFLSEYEKQFGRREGR